MLRKPYFALTLPRLAAHFAVTLPRLAAPGPLGTLGPRTG